MVTYTINLDLLKDVYTNFKCKQNDDIVLKFNIYKNSLMEDLTGANVILNALRNNNTFVKQTSGIIIKDNIITIDCLRDITRVGGKLKLELVIQKNDKQTTTFNIDATVVNSVITSNAEASKNVVSAIEDLDNKIAQGKEIVAEVERKKIEAIDTVSKLKENTIASVTKLKDTTIEQLNTTKKEVEELKQQTIEESTNIKDSAIAELSKIKTSSITELTKIKQDSIAELNNIKDTANTDLIKIKKDTITEVNNAVDRAIEEINKYNIAEVNEKIDKHIIDNNLHVSKDLKDSITKNAEELEKIKLDMKNNSSSVLTATYEELTKLKNSKSLITGSKYLLTDYQTKYQQPTTLAIKEMQVEQLILTASSSNAFEPIVYSSTYPQDIIYYNFNNNKCEDNITDRKGFIEYRIDTTNKNEAPQDWRTMLWIRYKPDTTQYYKNDVLTNYNTWSSGKAIQGELYKVGNALYVAKNENIPKSSTDSDVFEIVYKDINIATLTDDKTVICRNTSVKSALKIGAALEYPTFGNECKNNKILESSSLLHNNVLGKKCLNNYFGKQCIANTLAGNNSNNLFGPSCYKNFLGENCDGNSFGNQSTSNYLGESSSRNNFTSSCPSNTLTKLCSNNKFGNACGGNSLAVNCGSNSFENSCSSMVLESGCNSNSFGNGCFQNTIGYSSGSNSFGNGCYSNVLGANCIKNSFGISCILNSFGNSCTSNTFGNNCINNIFGNNFHDVFSKSLSAKNVSNIDAFKYHSSLITIEFKEGGTYAYWYLNASNQPVYTNIP